MNCCGNRMAMGRVVCPTPRRVGPFDAGSRLIMPLRFLIRSNGIGAFDTKQGAESMGLIFYKEDHETEQCTTLASSPPFFFGSPPCRSPNTLVQDSHFGLENLIPKCSSQSNSALPSSAHTRAEFGTKQATMKFTHMHHDFLKTKTYVLKLLRGFTPVDPFIVALSFIILAHTVGKA